MTGTTHAKHVTHYTVLVFEANEADPVTQIVTGSHSHAQEYAGELQACLDGLHNRHGAPPACVVVVAHDAADTPLAYD